MRVPDENAATLLEVREAIDALGDPQLLRLKKYAYFLIKGLGRKALGRDYQDLLNEALGATLAGDRRWNKKRVDFLGHLMGVMRSISSHWAERFDPDEAFLEAEVTVISPDGEENNPMSQVPTKAPEPVRVILAQQEIDAIRQMFADDLLVSLIIDGLAEDLTGPEIQVALEISETEYETAMKRMRRKVRGSLAEGGGRYV